MNFLEYFIIPVARITFDDTAPTWSFHLSLSSVLTPRHLTVDYCSIGSPDISKFALSSSPVILSFKRWLVRMGKDVVLGTFNDNLLSCNHFLRFCDSEFIKWVMSLMSLVEWGRLLSSAYIVVFEHVNVQGKSFI